MTMRHVLLSGASGGLGSAIRAAFLERREWMLHRLSRAELTMGPAGGHRALDFAGCEAAVFAHAAPVGSTLRELLEIDVALTAEWAEAMLASMAHRGRGRVILFSSIRAHAPRVGQAAYATAKAAVEGWARAMAVEYGGRGVTVNVIAPGAVITPRTTRNLALGTVTEAELVGRTPRRQLTIPAEVAGAAVWLATAPEAAAINGQVLVVDGGWSVSG